MEKQKNGPLIYLSYSGSIKRVSVPFSIIAALFSLMHSVWWTPQKTSWLLIENCVVSESLQSQKTFAKDIPVLFNEQETVQLTSTDLACRYRIPERLWGKNNGQYDEAMHSWADDAVKNSCLIW